MATNSFSEEIAQGFERVEEALKAQKVESTRQYEDLKTTVNTRLDGISSDVKSLEGDVKSLKGDVKSLKGDVKSLDGRTQRMEAAMGGMQEARMQLIIVDEWGAAFAKSRQFRSINDFAPLFLIPSIQEDDITAAFTLMDPLLGPLEVEAPLLVADLSDLLVRSGLITEPLVADGAIIVERLKKLVKQTTPTQTTPTQKTEDNSVSYKLSLIVRLCDSNNQVGQLKFCDGPGVMLLLSLARRFDQRPFFASVSLISDFKALEALFPPASLEVDCQGRPLFCKSQHGQLHIGEIKSGGASGTRATAIKQLGSACAAMAAILRIVYDVPSDKINRVGSIFVPRQRSRQGLTSELQQDAISNWKFSLYLREV